MAPLAFLLFVLLVPFAAAQQAQSSSTTAPQPSNTTTASNVTSILTSVPVTRTSISRGSTLQTISFVPTTILSTIHPNATATTAANATATNTTSPTQSSGPVLDTQIDPAFGVLGALLILTGLPSAFLGHKNRWSSFFLTGFYSFSLACLALILKFGVLVAVHPPNKTLRGLFVLACGVAGFAGGGVAIFFWHQAKYFIGAWGGFSLGLWIQCFRNGGLIRPIGFRWILYIGCGAVGFVMCTIPKLHYHVLIAGTAITGASAFMLGVDCFTTAGLKEFYVYNLGFSGLFPKFAGIPFPLSQTMEVEIGLVAAVALMGAATQLRVLKILKRKLAEINEEERQREVAAEAKAVVRLEHVQRDLEAWEAEHGKFATHGRNDSAMSGVPLMKDVGDSNPSTPIESTINGQRPRTRSGLSEFMGATEEETRPLSRFNQTPGLLPAMNLGLGLDSELPENMVGSDGARTPDPDKLKKEELLAEIQTIRRSIDALRSEADSASGDSRRPSMRSRTLSVENALAQAQNGSLRPPRPERERERVRSMDMLGSSSNNRESEGAAIGRPISAPLRDDDWDAYVRERKLFQPPSGASAPIPTTPIGPVPRPAAALLSVPDAVTEALVLRKRRESALEFGGPSNYAAGPADAGTPGDSTPSVDTTALAPPPRTHRRSASAGPMNILPPRASAAAAAIPERPEATRTRTFEELQERHQEKMRALQEPLSRQEKEQADLAAAKSRWERSKQIEKDVMARRRADKEAALVRKGKEESRRSKGEGPRPSAERHSRSLSGDRLAVVGGGSGGKRASTAKVQEWQRYQQDAEKDTQRRGTSSGEQGVLPFPKSSQQQQPQQPPERRRSRSGVLRDPPS